MSNKKFSNRDWKNNKTSYYSVRKTGGQSWKKSRIHQSSGLNKRNKKPSFWGFIFNKKTFSILSFFLLLLFIVGLFFFISISRSLPDPNKLIDRDVAQSTKIYDRTGENILYEIYGDEERTMVDVDELPDYIKNATISIEDKNFYKHKGISLWGIFRAVVWQGLRGKRVQGGSTLTQQLVKNAILSPERKIERKVKEWILAYRIEKKYSKDEILQMYFNEIPYGSTAYGVEAASQKYFGKNAQNINLAEAAILAALPQAPTKYSPFGANKDQLIYRQKYILDLMLEQNFISEEDAEAAKNYELKFKEASDNIIAPHFVMYVKELLAEKYGEKTIEQNGFKIYTTLDLYKQKIAEEVIAEKTKNYPEQYNANNASLVSIDPKTGQILAMVGSRDYYDETIDGQVNVSIRDRQPGSSIKPIVYASAFKSGYTPDTILYDVVTNFSTDENKPYQPHNYNLKENGPVTIKKALAGSLNIPAVKTLYLTGVNNVLDLAEDMGYTTLKDRSRFGLSLVLGGGEVKLLEHTNAFSAFAREGLINPTTSILKIEDKDGNIIEEYKNNDKKILETEVARNINDILSDNDARSYIFGVGNYLNLGSRAVAAKSGTTNDYRDAWTIGYTPSIVTGVWVGNNNNKEMSRGADGGVIAAPIWQSYMKKILGDTPIESFKKPEKILIKGKPILNGQTEEETVKIDRASGLRATELTPKSFIEEKTYLNPRCILHFIKKDDPRGERPKDPEKDPQYKLWESAVQEWAKKNNIISSSPPSEYDNLHLEENRPTFQITRPENNEIISSNILSADIQGTAPRGINRAEYYINNNLLTINYNYPFNLEEDINFLGNGYHNFKVVVCDDIDNCSEKSIEINLLTNNNQPIKIAEVVWQSPKSSIALNKIDFPFNIELKILNPQQIAKINVYTNNENNESQLISTIKPQSETETYVWQEVPLSGAYRLYAEYFLWSGSLKKTNEIILSISN